MSGATRSVVLVSSLALGCLAAGVALGRCCWQRHRHVFAEAARVPDAPRDSQLPLPSFADIVAGVAPGVVTVAVRLEPPAARAEAGAAEAAAKTRPVAAPEVGMRTGSGFLVHAGGLAVTSRHVVADASAIEVLTPSRGRFAAVVVGEDPAADLALLRLVAAPADLPVLELGASEDLRAGDWIVAVGNPYGFAQTVTAGIVSYVGRHLLQSDFGVTSDFLQFSAPVNPGSSGCPVFDTAGHVVGVTTQAAEAAQGISFAVPSRTLKWALDEMERRPDGRVRRAYLGIEFRSLTAADLAPARAASSATAGAVIVRVAAGEPAAKAGLRRGDIVLRIDGEPIADARGLHDQIVRRDPGTRIALELLRDGARQGPIDAVLGEVGGRPAGSPN